jgi:hypothetical protein
MRVPSRCGDGNQPIAYVMPAGEPFRTNEERQWT